MSVSLSPNQSTTSSTLEQARREYAAAMSAFNAAETPEEIHRTANVVRYKRDVMIREELYCLPRVQA
jgi:hypothetical protein